jgi:hypothetical protein
LTRKKKWTSWLLAAMLLVLLLLPACSAAGSPQQPQADPTRLSLDPGTIQPAASAIVLSPTLTALPASTTFTPSPNPTPAPVLRQLTAGGCCVGPFWSPDSAQVLYLDRPAPDAPAGIWSVAPEGGEPALVTNRLGLYSQDMAYLAYPENGITVIERAADGARWNLANGGRAVAFSPDNTLLAWTAGQTGPPFDTARRTIWISAIAGSQARPVADVFGGSLVGWLPGGRLLISGRLDAQEPETSLWVVDLEAEQWVEILRSGQRLRGTLISPEGGWLAYQVLFGEKPEDDGLWAVNLVTGERKKLTLFGAYRWRAEGQLLVVPLDMTSPIHQLWEVAVLTGKTHPLTSRAVTPLRIANGDWAVSPDGKYIVYVSAVDDNIWVMDLPKN